MKRFTFIMIIFTIITVDMQGQTFRQRLSYTADIGSGIAMNEPSHTPFLLQITGRYHLNKRFTIGGGTGISVYEKALIPLYASTQFFITQPKKITPYLECNIGGAFAAANEAKGGFYLSPSIGVQWNIASKLKLNIAIGYELQEMKRVKKHQDEYFSTAFNEELSHQSLTFKTGITL